MLESAEVGHKVAKATYAREKPKLREALLNGQYEMGSAQRGPILVLLSGLEGGGRGDTANTLNEWMDPRYIRTTAFGPGTPEEEVRPLAWRYWRALPPRGKVGIFMNAWYRKLATAHVHRDVTPAQFDASLQEIRQYEQMLSDEGVTLLKFWIHLSRAGQQERLKALSSNPKTAWRVTLDDRRGLKHYNKYHQVWEKLLRETSTGAAPWYVVEGTDSNYRNLTVGKILRDALVRVNAGTKATPRAVVAPAPSVIGNVALIRNLDLTKKLDEETYERDLAKWQAKLAALTQRKEFRDRSLVLAFEGSDAAGKGGAIRRVATSLGCASIHHCPHLPHPPRRKRPSPFSGGSGDRCRLVAASRSSIAPGTGACWWSAWKAMCERIGDWMRAYDEINQFEEQLVRAGAVVCKFWLQISKEEQLKRFAGFVRKSPFKQLQDHPGRLAQPEEMGTRMNRRSRTWLTAHPPSWRRGLWSRPKTRISRA